MSTLPRTLFGYVVTERLGLGALSTIYAVKDPKTAQRFALKHVVPQTEKHVRFVEQLQNEFEISKKFRHPALRKAIDLKISKRLFGGIKEAALVLEMFDGKPIDQDHPGALRHVADCMIKAGKGLAALHSLRLVHCDTKPGNILRNEAGDVKLIDFGQTCPVETTKQRVQGTPDFIAPEQVKCRPVGFYTDIFNFGATLYWAVTNRRIPTLMTVDRKSRSMLADQDFPKPHEINPLVPEDLSLMIMKCVRINIEQRPRTIGEVLQVLEPYARPTPPRA
jgi:serine/threonine-protein kinase